MYEVLWYLQTASPDKATALLQHLRATQGDDLGVIFKNFEMGRRNSSESGPASETKFGKNDSPPTSTDSPSSTMLAVPEIMDHPRFSTVRKGQTEVTGITLLAPNHENASVSNVHGPLEMFFNCVGALFYIMNRNDVQACIEAIKASGNENMPLGHMFSNGSTIELRTYAAEIAGMASIGVIHSQLADPTKAPPPELADYFYAVAKHGLDSAILYDPLRAMNVCALLGMYNIVVKATVALAYIGTSHTWVYTREITPLMTFRTWSEPSSQPQNISRNMSARLVSKLLRRHSSHAYDSCPLAMVSLTCL